MLLEGYVMFKVTSLFPRLKTHLLSTNTQGQSVKNQSTHQAPNASVHREIPPLHYEQLKTASQQQLQQLQALYALRPKGDPNRYAPVDVTFIHPKNPQDSFRVRLSQGEVRREITKRLSITG
jgi:hypothetical protein